MTGLSDRAELKEAVAGAIGSILDKIDREGRVPDAWERAYLVSAITMLFRGGYDLAGLLTMDAAASSDRRSPHAILPELLQYDTTKLRAALKEAIAEPLREWPHFGPIVFAPGSNRS